MRMNPIDSYIWILSPTVGRMGRTRKYDLVEGEVTLGVNCLSAMPS